MWSLLMNQKFKNSTRNLKPKNGLAGKVTLFMLHENGIVKNGLTPHTGVSQTVSPKLSRFVLWNTVFLAHPQMPPRTLTADCRRVIMVKARGVNESALIVNLYVSLS